MKIPLTALKNGETGVIIFTDCLRTRRSSRKVRCMQRGKKSLKKHFSTELCIKRLTDLGLTPGTKVTVIKSAPFHGPLEINIRGSRLAIGRGMASRIIVETKR
jgi:Fe2+ transport system protein FeoA